ncbi:MAG: YtxH domain-containing protein [Bacteroidetes bacterium]|nr:YtxH domain-containing protein [Bacteroidota bacterium]
MKTGNVILGVLAGVATGAILGILFAPHSGAKTRRIILSKGEGYADAIKDKVDEYKGVLNNKYQGMKDDLDTFIEKETV